MTCCFPFPPNTTNNQKCNNGSESKQREIAIQHTRVSRNRSKQPNNACFQRIQLYLLPASGVVRGGVQRALVDADDHHGFAAPQRPGHQSTNRFQQPITRPPAVRLPRLCAGVRPHLCPALRSSCQYLLASEPMRTSAWVRTMPRLQRSRTSLMLAHTPLQSLPADPGRPQRTSPLQLTRQEVQVRGTWIPWRHGVANGVGFVFSLYSAR